MPWKDLGFGAATQTPPLASEHIQSKPHKEHTHVPSAGGHPIRDGTGKSPHGPAMNLFSLCFLSWSPGPLLVLLCGSESCSVGPGLNTPAHFVTTCGVFTPKVQSWVWWWLPSVQEWVLECVVQTVVVVVQLNFQYGKAVQSLPKLSACFWPALKENFLEVRTDPLECTFKVANKQSFIIYGIIIHKCI